MCLARTQKTGLAMFFGFCTSGGRYLAFVNLFGYNILKKFREVSKE
jgi:hypothetical protein